MAVLRSLPGHHDAEVDVTIGAEQVVRLGRRVECDVVIPVDEISGLHARIEREAGAWWIVDLGSTNGTTVDLAPAKPHVPHRLEDRSVIDLGGRVQLRFELESHERVPSEPTVRVSGGESVRLTPTESEVLELLFQQYDEGRSTPRLLSLKEIADLRFTSSGAVRMALQSMYDKLGLFGSDERNKESLARRAQELGVTRRRW